MATIPMEITVGKLPVNPRLTAKELFLSMVRRIRGVVPGSKVIVGSLESTEPAYDVGLWFPDPKVALLLWNPDIWSYNYRPVVFESGGNRLTVNGAPTVNRIQSFQNADGTIALKADVYIPRDIALLDTVSGTVPINPTAAENFYCRLVTNTTITFSAALPEGKTIIFHVLNNGTEFTFSLPGGILWDSGATPTQPVAGVGGSGYAEYRVTMVNGSMYGEFTDYEQTGSPTGTITYPAIPRDYAGTQAPPAGSRLKNLP